uniref:Potassium channel tetramerisation-type BTB domain-containing protein n=4 Tax=Parascaris univalens TaxID=6257 RepID=A0A915AWC9_PARUN
MREIAQRTASPTTSEATDGMHEKVAGDSIIKLNIGGTSYSIRASTLISRDENSRLANFARGDADSRLSFCDAYFAGANEYYFERSPKLFEAIFKFYVTGQLHRPLDVCINEFNNELHYWSIPDDHLPSCCWRDCNTMNGSLEMGDNGKSTEPFDAPQTVRMRVRKFCEGDGSMASTLFSFASISFVLISVFGLVFGSIHEFQQPIVKVGSKSRQANLSEINGGNSQVIWEPMPIFGHIETVCIVWFTLEYLLRLTVASNRLQFIFAVMNIVDLLAIIPFYLEISLTICGIDFASLSDIKGALLVVRVLRVLRVVRILKLGRYSSGMRTFALTLKSSARQLGMMGMVLSTGVVFFSTLLYFVEKDEAGTPFTSIPAAFWWAIVTMTTVGYGDYVPVTVPGKLIASGAILSGVLVLALPITIIVDNFMKVSGNANPNSMFPTQQPQVSNAYS